MYHLSFSNLGPKTILDIKRPSRSYSEEKDLPERVCFAPTLEQCVYGMEGIIDSNKDIVLENLLKRIKHHQEMILSEHPDLVATNKQVFPDLAIDVVSQECFQNYPEIFKKHFMRKYNRLINMYEESVFSDEYYEDRSESFFKDIGSVNKSEFWLNLTCYKTAEKLVKAVDIADFSDTGEMWSLKPILVERVGFLSTKELVDGKYVLVDNNINLIH